MRAAHAPIRFAPPSSLAALAAAASLLAAGTAVGAQFDAGTTASTFARGGLLHPRPGHPGGRERSPTSTSPASSTRRAAIATRPVYVYVALSQQRPRQAPTLSTARATSRSGSAARATTSTCAARAARQLGSTTMTAFLRDQAAAPLHPDRRADDEHVSRTWAATRRSTAASAARRISQPGLHDQRSAVHPDDLGAGRLDNDGAPDVAATQSVLIDLTPPPRARIRDGLGRAGGNQALIDQLAGRRLRPLSRPGRLPDPLQPRR